MAQKLTRWVPPGFPLRTELTLFTVGNVCAFLYSLTFLFRFWNSYRDLFVWARGVRWGLEPGAVMPDFVQLLDRSLWGFGAAALCMLLLIPLERGLRYVPTGAGLAVSAALFALLRNVNRGTLGFEGLVLSTVPAELYRNDLTAYLGFPGPGFFSTDYFSLLPWLFLFLAGYFLHRLCAPALERADPDILRCRPLCALGRWSLPVYMIHQPVVYGVLTLFAALMR